MRYALRLLFNTVLVLAGCGRPETPAQTRAGGAIVLLDSAAVRGDWNPMGESLWTYRYLVRSGARADTIANVIEPLPPVVTDATVLGLTVIPDGEDSWRRQIFRLDRRNGETEQWDLPPDVFYIFHDVALSPDGKYVAYVASDTTPGHFGEFGVVRRLRGGEPIVASPSRGGCECDVDRNHARWPAPDSFEIAVALLDSSGGWERVSGRASLRRLHIDTLASQPEWHRAARR